jgi:hypothetical protein
MIAGEASRVEGGKWQSGKVAEWQSGDAKATKLKTAKQQNSK